MQTLIHWASTAYYSIVPFVLLLGVLIFVHEMGHFLVALWCGVRVEVFSLGFGKKIFQFKRGHTTYCLSIIPLGGYVKMFGDEPGVEVAPELRSQAFTHKKLWQRFAIVAAGPLMNLIISFLIFTLISVLGEEQRLPVLGDVLPGTKAYSLGFRSGDKIVSVDAQPVLTWDQMQNFMTAGQGHAIRFSLLRANDKLQMEISAIPELVPNPNPISTEDLVGAVDGLTNSSRAAVVGVLPGSLGEKLGLKTGDRILTVNGKDVNYFRELENVMITAQNQPVQIKVDRYSPTAKDDETAVSIVNLAGKLGDVPSLASLGLEASDLHLAKVIDGSPAAKAGIKADDKITKINGVVPTAWEDVLNTVKSYAGTGAIKVEVLRDGKNQQYEITPSLSSLSSSQGLEEKRYTIGIMPWIQNAVPPLGIIRADTAGEALHRGVYRTKEVTGMIVVSFLRLFQAKISPKNIGGVIAIGQAASETFKSGIGHFLQLMGVLSINLFIINLLPIPVLDGGHLLFYAIEGLKGTPLGMRKMELAQQVGLVLLISLMALSLFNDVSRHFGLW
jgi:regulator of sigma E protease